MLGEHHKKAPRREEILCSGETFKSDIRLGADFRQDSLKSQVFNLTWFELGEGGVLMLRTLSLNHFHEFCDWVGSFVRPNAVGMEVLK